MNDLLGRPFYTLQTVFNVILHGVFVLIVCLKTRNREHN